MVSSSAMDDSVRDRDREPRLVYLEMKKSHSLGISLVGGNAVGIFVHSVQMDSPAHKVATEKIVSSISLAMLHSVMCFF